MFDAVIQLNQTKQDKNIWVNPFWLYEVKSYLNKFAAFHGIQISLPLSQEPTSDPYCEQYQSLPHPPILISLRSVLILSSHLRHVFQLRCITCNIFVSRYAIQSFQHPVPFKTKCYTNSKIYAIFNWVILLAIHGCYSNI